MAIEKIPLNPIGTEDAKRIINKLNEVIDAVNKLTPPGK
nr:MAG TPA: Sacsin-helical domain, homodimerization, Chaperone [Caudoviricetes sp.]